jgi:hypothetical protein
LVITSRQGALVRQQVLVNAQHHLAADLERRRQQQIEGTSDGALGRVFDRHHSVVGMTGLDFAKDIVDRNLRHQARRVTEMLGRGASEKVPSGPRKAMPSGCSSDRQADITSRKNQVTLSFDKRSPD